MLYLRIMIWDDKSINRYVKGETFHIDVDRMKGSFTIKYVSVKCDNAVDIILDDDFLYQYYYRGEYKKISCFLHLDSVKRINKDIRRNITPILREHFKLLGFGLLYYNTPTFSRTYTDFKIRKIVYPKKDVRP